MRSFVFGIAVTIAVHLVGWDNVVTVLGWADGAAKETAAAIEEQAAHVRAEINRRERARRGAP
jgi:hypothetical protein